MGVEIVGETVKLGILSKLLNLFPSPDFTHYREAVTPLRFPHFFIFQMTLDISPDTYNHWWINYLINIRYRHANDPSTVVDIQRQLDAIALDLAVGLDYIDFMGERFRIDNLRSEKVDNVLQCFCNVIIHATKPLPEVIKQLELTTIINQGDE